MKSFQVKNSIYGYTLYVRSGGSSTEAEAWFANRLGFEEEISPSAYAIARTNGDGPSGMIWFREDCPGAAIIAHESMHSVCHVMASVGMGKLSSSNEEAYCYLLQWTVEEISKRLWK